jgi:hypothetical protein
MSPTKRGNRRIVISSDSDDSATDLVNRRQPEEHQNPQEQSEVSSDEGSSDSADPVSRKARKLAVRQAQKHHQVPAPANPFTYAMQHGKFPKPEPGTLQQHPAPSMLTDPGYLWNAVPKKTCQYLDMEAVHAGSDISEGSTGTSDGSLSDSSFIDKETPQDSETAENRELLQRMFPKTFGPNKNQKHTPQCRFMMPESDASKSQVQLQLHNLMHDGNAPPDSSRNREDDDKQRPTGIHSPEHDLIHKSVKVSKVLVHGIIKFPVWKRAPELSHPATHQH